MLGLLLTAAEVAHILHISRSNVYELFRSGEMITMRLGHAVRVRPDDLEAYVYENRLDYGKTVQEFLKRQRG